MADYRKMYFELAGKVADVIEILVKAQRDGEDSVINDQEICKIIDLEKSEHDFQSNKKI